MSKSEGTDESTDDFDSDRALRVRLLMEEPGRSSAKCDLAGDLTGDPLSVPARLLLGVCAAGDSKSSAKICFAGELFSVLARLLFGVGAAASTKSSSKFFAGDDLSGLLRSFNTGFLLESI